uniref:Uncharacterized protein n=1 Tax=Anguilla anguilla TaxID=7936 RepID=A0A0E9VC95_ANGAN
MKVTILTPSGSSASVFTDSLRTEPDIVTSPVR